jgi:peptidyl-dipeptidase A
VPRSEADFDPGAKYHVPANVPYARYFLASILQFQFHRSLCQAGGLGGAETPPGSKSEATDSLRRRANAQTGPLNRCSIYDNKEVGRRLEKMLAMGQSRPWPDALEALTGQREMDATAIADYFAPLKKWLDEQNAGHAVGW